MSVSIAADVIPGLFAAPTGTVVLSVSVTSSPISGNVIIPTGYNVIITPLPAPKSVEIDCQLAILETDTLQRLKYGMADNAPAISGYVFPRVIYGIFSITPARELSSILVNNINRTKIRGSFSLTGSFVPSVVIDASTSARYGSKLVKATFVLSGDVSVAKLNLEPVYIPSGESLNLSNFVAWSKIGSVELAFDLTNDSGIRPMAWSGSLLNILQLGNGCVLYGTNGVTRMYPVSSPFPTFGFADLDGIGIDFKLSVAGDKTKHFFVSNNRELFVLTEKGVTKLGFEQYLSSMDINTVLTWDERNNRLYLSDNITGFIYTPNGLGGGFRDVTSIYNASYNSQLVFPSTVDQSSGFEFISEVYTFGSSNLKTLSKVSITTNCQVPLYVSVGYKVHQNDTDYSWTTNRQFNNEGIATIAVSGIEFKFKISTQTYCEMEIDEVRVRYKLSDKRHRFEYNPHSDYARAANSVIKGAVDGDN